MAAALQIEARNGRWGIMADGFYAYLGASGETRSSLYGDSSVDLKQFLGEIAVAYRVYQGPNSFVDLYGGFRYNSLDLDMNVELDVAGIDAASQQASRGATGTAEEIASEIIKSELEGYKNASASQRNVLAAEVDANVRARVEDQAQKQLALQLKRARKEGGLNERDLNVSQIVQSVRSESLELARSTAELAKAELRAAAGEVTQNVVSEAQEGVDQAEKALAKAVSSNLQTNLPTSASGKREWFDPIIGARWQWNFREHWFLAAKGDIGGFGVGSDFTWNTQATVGYQFTSYFSTELGYRYFDTDYRDGDFSYDVAEHGVFLGFNFTF